MQTTVKNIIPALLCSGDNEFFFCVPIRIEVVSLFLGPNFGESQYCLGASFWEEDLRALSVFQLSVEEARDFFSGCGRNKGRPSGWNAPR